MFYSALNLALQTDACGLGATTTITRSELVASLVSLDRVQYNDVIFASDSLASMYMTKTQLHDPAQCAVVPRSTWLTLIAARLCARTAAGLNTTIIKGRAQNGIYHQQC